jgi:hypothetical protein
MADFAGEQIKGVELECMSYALHASETEIPLSSLKSSHVRPMEPKHFGERLLRQASLQAVAAQPLPEGPRQVAFRHTRNRREALLVSLHTYK